jgi:hypothetical protein
MQARAGGMSCHWAAGSRCTGRRIAAPVPGRVHARCRYRMMMGRAYDGGPLQEALMLEWNGLKGIRNQRIMMADSMGTAKGGQAYSSRALHRHVGCYKGSSTEKPVRALPTTHLCAVASPGVHIGRHGVNSFQLQAGVPSMMPSAGGDEQVTSKQRGGPPR